MSTRVFISYSRRDNEYVDRLVCHLRTHGLDPWLDRNIDYSAQWWQTIVERLRVSDAVVLVMTPALEASEWVIKEVLLARREGKPIFPLLLAGDGLPLVIDIQHVDVTGGAMPPDDFVAALAGQRAPAVDANRSEVNLDAVVRELERQEESLAAADRAVAGGRADVQVHVVRSHALNQLLRSDEALAAAQAALAIDPTHRGALIEKGNALGSLGLDGSALTIVDFLEAHYAPAADIMALRSSALASLDPSEGLRWAERAIAADPNDIDAMTAKSSALSGVARHDEAIAAADTAIAAHPGHPWGYLIKTFVMLSAGQSQEARPLLDSICLIYPRSDLILLMVALSHMSAGEMQLAESTVERAIALNPGRSLNHSILAALFEATGRDADALSALENAVRAMPNPPEHQDAPALARYGILLRRLGRPIDARLAIEQAHAINPKAADPLLGLSLLAIDDGDAGLARQRLSAALDRDRDQVDLALIAGTRSRTTGDPSKALLICDMLIELGYSTFDVLFERGLALRSLDRLGEAVAALTEAERELPDAAGQTCATLLCVKGNILARQLRRPEEGFQALRRARELDPEDPVILGSMAEAALLSGHQQEAAALFVEAAKVDPQEHVIPAASLMLNEGKNAEALLLLDGISEMMASSGQYHILRARCLQALDRNEEALVALRHAEWVFGDAEGGARVDAIVHQGAVLRELGRPRDARIAFERARSLDPTAPEPLTGLVMLAADERHGESVRELVQNLIQSYDSGLVGDMIEVAERVLAAREFQSALDLLDRLESFGSQVRRGNWLRAMALSMLDRNEEALAALRPVIAALPAELTRADADVLELRGDLMHKLGRRREAWTDLRRAAELNPDGSGIRVSLAALALDDGNARAAVRHALSALDLDQRAQYQNDVLILGQRLDNIGRHQEALQVAERLLADGWDTTSARFLRWHSLHQLGQSNQAADALAQLADVVPDDLGVQEAAANALFGERAFDRTVRYAERAAALGSADADLYLKLAIADLSLDRAAQAVDAATRALALDPKNVQAARILTAARQSR